MYLILIKCNEGWSKLAKNNNLTHIHAYLYIILIYIHTIYIYTLNIIYNT